jgi:hypothetical protein
MYLSHAFSAGMTIKDGGVKAVLPPGLPAFLATAIVVSAILFILVLRATGGVFGFTLDDPYIGLAFASRMMDGHFGINPYEAVDPSSSILFRFPVAMLLKLSGGPLTVFLFDLSFVAVTAFVLMELVRDAGIDLSQVPAWRVVVTALAMLLGLNLIGIAFTGLEHPLHIADTLACLLGIVRTVRTGRMPRWLPIVLVLNPLLRYEGLSIWGAGIIILWWKQHRAAALLTFAAGTVFVGSYSLYLHHLGLPLLPGSVMTKSTVASSIGGSGVLTHLLNNFQKNLRQYGSIQLLAILALLAVVSIRNPAARAIALFVALPVLAHLVVGAFGGFGRYEIYILTFGIAALVTLYADIFLRWLASSPLVFASGIAVWMVAQIGYVQIFCLTPSAAAEVHLQQFQMHRFAVGFWQKPVAVNDLGWVAYGNPNYILDLAGLGSETARVARTNAGTDIAWMDRLVQQHHIGLAMIYTSWFPILPPNWNKLATLSLDQPNVVSADRTVTFFATAPEAREELEDELMRFSSTLPSGVTLTRNEQHALVLPTHSPHTADKSPQP